MSESNAPLCNVHRQYQAKRKPTADCQSCREAWASSPYNMPPRDEAAQDEYALAPVHMFLDKGIIEAIAFHCGDGGGSYGDYQDGLLFIGEITDDDGRQVHGLHIACAECEEEGYTTLVEFTKRTA